MNRAFDFHRSSLVKSHIPSLALGIGSEVERLRIREREDVVLVHIAVREADAVAYLDLELPNAEGLFLL